MLGSPILYLKGMGILMFQLSGFYCTWKGRGLSKLVISGVIIRVTPCRALITLLITYLLSPLPLQVVPLKAAFTEPGQEPRLQNLLNNRNIEITNNKKNKNR